MMAGVSMFGVGGSVCNVTPQEKFCSTFTKQTSLRLSVTDGKSSGLNDERIPLTADRSTFYPSWRNSTEKVKVMLPVPDRVANNFTLNAPSKITAYRIFGRARADNLDQRSNTGAVPQKINNSVVKQIDRQMLEDSTKISEGSQRLREVGTRDCQSFAVCCATSLTSRVPWVSPKMFRSGVGELTSALSLSNRSSKRLPGLLAKAELLKQRKSPASGKASPSDDLSDTIQSPENREATDATEPSSFLQRPKPLEATAMMRVETLFFVQLLEQFHCSKKKLSDVPMDEMLRSYISALDGQKMIFTQAQVDWFVKEYRNSAELLWRAGSLTPGFLLADLYRRRFRERIQWIRRRLEQPFDFSSKETFIEDRKDAAFAPDTAVLDALWERRLQHELINEAASCHRDMTDVILEGELAPETDESAVTEATVAENETKARERLKEWYGNLNTAIQSLEPSDVQELYCNALSQFYDPHTNFLSADSMEDFSIELRNSLVGIGAVLKEDRGSCIINELMPGGPAERCGQLQAGDKILAVAQERKAFVNIQGMRLRRSVKLIRGKKGTVVRLLIQPANGDPSQRKTVELVRDEIKLEDKLAFAKVFIVPDACGCYRTIGWIDVPSFYGSEDGKDAGSHSVSKDVRTLIERLKTVPVEGLVLDMRRNGGGLLTEAVKLAGLFLNHCPVVQVRGSDMNNCLYADTDGCVWNGPLLAVTSRFSASAAEIAVGALQVMRRALVFGAPATHGKGSVQAMIEMDKLPFLTGDSPLGAAKLTIQKWYLPDGSSVQLLGVRPDIVRPSLSDCLPVGEADLPHALPWDRVKPMQTEISPEISGRWLRSSVLQMLLQRQRIRERKKPYFDWYRRQTELFAKRYKQTEYPLNLKARIARINEDRRLNKALSDEETAFFPLRYGYRLLTLGDPSRISGKPKKQTFDFFEQEALDIMTDWVSMLSIQPQIFLWCYAKRRLF